MLKFKDNKTRFKLSKQLTKMGIYKLNREENIPMTQKLMKIIKVK